MRIEAARQAVRDLPITPSVLATLRATARLYSTHYSTMIEGNRLTREQVSRVIERQQHFPERERHEKEVLGYITPPSKRRNGLRRRARPFRRRCSKLSMLLSWQRAAGRPNLLPIATAKTSSRIAEAGASPR